jgi:hypothetical protein
MKILNSKWNSYCVGKWIKQTYDPETPSQRLVRLLFFMAVSDGADRIVLGRPSGPYSIEPQETVTLAGQVSAGNLTKEEEAEIESLLNEDKDFSDEINQIIAEHDPFRSSEIKEIPVLARCGSAWHEYAPLSLRLHHVLIDSLVYHLDSGIVLEQDGTSTHHVHYSLSMQENFCYSIMLNKVTNLTEPEVGQVSSEAALNASPDEPST